MYELEMKTPVPEQQQLHTHQMMERVLEIAPYSSTCRGLVDKTDGGFKVQVEVRSQGGLLTGQAESLHLNDALKEAESNVEKQIVQWRKMRF